MMRIAFVAASLGVCSSRVDKAPLPEVDSVLGKANSKAHDFAEQALAMQQRLHEQQEKSRQALAADKKSYEDKLQEVSQLSETISARNNALKAGNRMLETTNDDKFAYLKNFQAKGAEMRRTLQGITKKVSAAQLFLENSLTVTDDSNAEDLAILAPTTSRPTLDEFLAATKNKKVSLLAVRAMQQLDASEAPEEIVDALSNSLSEIAAAEAEGAADLKARFQANLDQLEKHQAKLNATEASLLKEQVDLKERQSKLMEAEKRLKATTFKLRKRLEGMRVFASTVGDEASGRKDTVNPPKPASTRVAANGTDAAANKTTLAALKVHGSKRVPSVFQPTEAAKPAVVSVVQKAQTAAAPVGNETVSGWKSWFAQLRR